MIHRIDVRGKTTPDPLGEAVRHQIAEFSTDVGPITAYRIFLIDSPAGAADMNRVATELLADPFVEQVAESNGHANRIEIHLKPGVMDPVAASTEMAIRDMGIEVKEVRTGRAYVLEKSVPKDELQRIASRVLANGVIESVHFDRFVPKEFPAGHEYKFQLRHVSIRNLSDDELKKLSREGHLFLSLAEMKAIQSYFREQSREPTDIELETLAQTWSEHCVHKTLKSGVEVIDEQGNVLRKYGNLIKETIFASTMELNRTDFCLSVFKDNAGVIAFDETDAVCFKVETHNHPSAIEPYGGSATGAGGVIRDVMGTGLAAKPIANTDIFCIAFPDYEKRPPKKFHEEIEKQVAELLREKLPAKSDDLITVSVDRETGNFSATHNGQEIEKTALSRIAAQTVREYMQRIVWGESKRKLPKGVIHPKRILQQVVAGVRDYGNRMGIPTVNGAVYFDDNFLGNPLVFCGCVGLIPRNKIEKAAQNGDAIVVMGGRTGRDGIHGATFSSAELTDTHADEFSHAVQIGNAITEKKMADVILQARDRNLFTAITDCGAGGLSSAVGEMGEKTGAIVELDKVPLKYAGLRYDEIWISEAQERMVLSVPLTKVKELLELSAGEDVEATVIGQFGAQNRELILQYQKTQVGRMSMQVLHDGIPMPTRKAKIFSSKQKEAQGFKSLGVDAREHLLKLLSHPNIASKHWIIRQYDHEVQGGSVIKPLTGPLQIGPSDASVIRPKLDSFKGVALACGFSPQILDPYEMTIASIDEAIRNVVAVGADPAKIAILDNFCWPSVDDEITMGTLVAACEACRDAALAYGIPFISGKDSLHNQFTNQETGQVIKIPRTLLISAIAVLDDVRKCVTMDLKDPREGHLLLIEPQDGEKISPAVHRAIYHAIHAEMISSCHDVSDGGWLVAAAEMCIASGLGLSLKSRPLDDAFIEKKGRYLVEVHALGVDALVKMMQKDGISATLLGRVNSDARLEMSHLTEYRSTQYDFTIDVADLTKAWRGTLDW